MQDNDERLRQAIRVGNIGIFEHNHDTDFIYWSPELRRIYGWDDDELATLPKILEHVHAEDADRVVAAVRRAHNPGGDGAFDIEHRIFDRGGQLRWVLTRSRTHFQTRSKERRPSRTIGAVQDVTESKRMQDALHLKDQAIASALIGVAMTDASGIVIYANREFLRLWNCCREADVLGRPLWEFSDPASAELIKESMDRLGSFKGEIVGRRSNGSTMALDVSACALRGSKGESVNVVASFADMTDRKRLEAQLLQVQKMECMGRLAGGIAHDFNNLLTVISGGIGISLSMLPPDHPIRSQLTHVADAAGSAATLTHQLLAFSRKQVIAPRTLDLNATIRRVQRMTSRLLGDDIVLETSCGRDLESIHFDLGQLEQIVLNLTVNARDAMPSGGRLVIRTSSVYLDEGYAQRYSHVSPGAYVLLEVSDNGTGMTEEVQTRLFEPFFTTKAAGEGTGLGLATVYSALRQNGGHIEVHSKLGKGSTFKIYLPVAARLCSRPRSFRPAAP